jgi:dimethylargininase
MLAALTRGVSRTINDCELTFKGYEPINVDLARQQHKTYEDLLRQTGVKVLSLPPLDKSPDAVFVEDTAVVLDEVLVPARMGVASRAGEVFSVAEELAFCRRVLSLPPQGTLEGGDVIRAWKTLFVGLSRRTDQAGIDGLRTILEPFGYNVVGVKVRGALHLKSACSYLGRNMLLLNSSMLDTKPFRGGYEILEVPSNEPNGANVLVVGETAIVPTAFPATAKLLRRMSFNVQPIDVSELLKAEAGVTCCSIVFDAPEGALSRKIR